jgi:hypothetical protein
VYRGENEEMTRLEAEKCGPELEERRDLDLGNTHTKDEEKANQ